VRPGQWIHPKPGTRMIYQVLPEQQPRCRRMSPQQFQKCLIGYEARAVDRPRHATDEGSRNDDRHFGGERVGQVHEQPQHKPNSQEQQNSCTSETEPEMTGVLLDSLPVLWRAFSSYLGLTFGLTLGWFRIRHEPKVSTMAGELAQPSHKFGKSNVPADQTLARTTGLLASFPKESVFEGQCCRMRSANLATNDCNKTPAV
jgi:hypothetical protein